MWKKAFPPKFVPRLTYHLIPDDMKPIPNFFKQLFLLTSMILSFNIAYAQDIYWVGGSGDWDDISHWSKVPGNQPPAPAGVIPNSGTEVVIDQYSGLTNSSTITIPPGDYEIKSLFVTSTASFTLSFDGTNSSSNAVSMSVFGDLDLTSTMNLAYSSLFTLDNVWKFDGPNNHSITTGNNDLMNVQFLNENGSFNQLGNLKATTQLRMFAGTWNSNGHNVNVGKLIFEDDNPSSSPLTKLFNTGSSNILCEEWESGFTYGSLTLTGTHTIYTPRFRGSPKQQNGPAFSYNDIHLLEYPDVPIGTPIEYNNFECRGCIIENITVEDTGDTKLADEFTVNGKFTVLNAGSSILFNGGNGRDSEVTFNGIIITPSLSGCTSRTIFASVYTDFSVFIKASGTLGIEDAVIDNIQASGGATFEAISSVLQGASTGWNLVNQPNPLNYVWIGTGGTNGDWDDPSQWVLASTGSSNGCIPSIVDNVIIDGNAKGNIRIPRPFRAECKDLIWTNKDGLELRLDGSNTLESALLISGDLQLEQSAIINAIGIHEIYFNSTGNNTITTEGVQLPEILFLGEAGEWRLNDDLNCDIITFEAGTFTTQNNDVTVDQWNAFEEYAKHFNFGSSTITVNGVMDLAEFATRNITINPGTSLIVCERLLCIEEVLYDVKLLNTSTYTFGNYNYDFNKLILGGTGEVRTVRDMILTDLVFEEEGSALSIGVGDKLTVNGGIESTTTLANPGILKSATSGTQVELDKDNGNICVIGPIAFQDIDAALSGVCHAPDGIDSGNNTDIDFDNGSSSTDLYWIAENGGTWRIQENWSRIPGGCPATKNPSNALNLIFDRNSFSNSPVTVLVDQNATVNNIIFKNAENLTLDISTSLYPASIEIDGGFMNAVGKTLDVRGLVDVNSSGFLTTDMTNFVTEELSTTSGVFIVRAGSTAKVKNP